jgi:hypothetical protein
MMGRRRQGQGQLFYEFRLDEEKASSSFQSQFDVDY